MRPLAQRRAARNDALHAAAQLFLDVVKDELVEQFQAMSVVRDELFLHGVRSVEQGALENTLVGQLFHDGRVHLVKHAGHSSHDGGLENGQVVDQIGHIAAVKSNAPTGKQHGCHGHPLKAVRQRQVGQIDIFVVHVGAICWLNTQHRSGHTGHNVAVRQHDALGHASSAARVQNGRQRVGLGSILARRRRRR